MVGLGSVVACAVDLSVASADNALDSVAGSPGPRSEA